MDTRKEHGQYWPGTRTAAGGETPSGTDNGKVDRVDLGTLPADATASEMRTAIRNIQNAMRPLATAIAAAMCGFAMAQTAAWDSLRGGVHVVTNEQDTAAMAAIAAATNDIAMKMAEQRSANATAIAASTNGIPEAIAGHETRIGALEESAADRPDMSLYALRAEVPQAVDLAPYATTTDVVNRISAAASATSLQIETLSRNTASAIANSTNGLPEKIAAATNSIPGRIAAATNGLPERIAAATNGLPERIASSTNALHKSLAPTISAASTALQPGATNNIPETLASHASELARLSQALAANTESNTAYRLMSQEGDVYQDATGAVWRVAYATNLSPWHVSSVFYTNGTEVATNSIPGVSTWSISGPYEITEGSGQYYYNLHIPAGGNIYAQNNDTPDEQPMELQFEIGTDIDEATFNRTNIVTRYWIPADRIVYESTVPTPSIFPSDKITDGTHTLYPSLRYTVKTVVPDTWNVEGTILYPLEQWRWNNGTMFLDYDHALGYWQLLDNSVPWVSEPVFGPSSMTNIDFYANGEIYHSFMVPSHTNMVEDGVAKVSEAQARLPYPTNSIPYSAIANVPPLGLTTNDVCNIVTNVTITEDHWTFTGLPEGATDIFGPFEDWVPDLYWSFGFTLDGESYFASVSGSPDDTSITFYFPDLDGVTVTAERHVAETRNSLGLAMYDELPQNTAVPQLMLKAPNGSNFVLKVSNTGALEVHAQ